MSITDAYGNQYQAPQKQQQATRSRRTLCNISFDKIFPDNDKFLFDRREDLVFLERLTYDEDIYSAMQTRQTLVSLHEYSIIAGGDSANDQKACDLITMWIDAINVSSLISMMTNAIFYGIQVFELLWDVFDIFKSKYILPQFVVDKPAWWFVFDDNAKLALVTDHDPIQLNEENFWLIRHKASSENPYGIRVLSRCGWGFILKKHIKNEMYAYLEKYGSLFLAGRLEEGNANEDALYNMEQALTELRGSGVIAYSGAEVKIIESANKTGSAGLFVDSIEMENRGFRKIILGGTLNDTSGGENYKTAQAKNEIRHDIAHADRRLIADAFNDLFLRITQINFSNTEPPYFEFQKDEEIHRDKADRDKVLTEQGVHFTKHYYQNAYKLHADDFELVTKDESNVSNFNTNLTETDIVKTTEQEEQEVRSEAISAIQTEAEVTVAHVTKMMHDILDVVDNSSSFEDAIAKLRSGWNDVSVPSEIEESIDYLTTLYHQRAVHENDGEDNDE